MGPRGCRTPASCSPARWPMKLNGSVLAVERLRPWLSDAERFPAAWIAAVHSTLRHARELATMEASPSR